MELLKICDDVYRSESLSNRTDPELKNIAIKGFKRVLTGGINDITNSLTYESSNLKALSKIYLTGRDTVR